MGSPRGSLVGPPIALALLDIVFIPQFVFLALWVDWLALAPIQWMIVALAALPMGSCGILAACANDYPARFALRFMKPAFWSFLVLFAVAIFLQVALAFAVVLIGSLVLLLIPGLALFLLRTGEKRLAFEAAVARGEAQRPVSRFPL